MNKHTSAENRAATLGVPRRRAEPAWRLTCILCARAWELDVVPVRRRCGACGGYCEANRTRDWNTR
ncbi:MAG: hypothetical protein JOZ81_32460 [Chloroflexi bacterium]|nr:hypothetical protein [Chloroflexota bacterium]